MVKDILNKHGKRFKNSYRGSYYSKYNCSEPYMVQQNTLRNNKSKTYCCYDIFGNRHSFGHLSYLFTDNWPLIAFAIVRIRNQPADAKANDCK